MELKNNSEKIGEILSLKFMEWLKIIKSLVFKKIIIVKNRKSVKMEIEEFKLVKNISFEASLAI